MAVLSRIRLAAFMALLIAAMLPGGAISANDECPDVGYCNDCDTPEGECFIPIGGGNCQQYPGCTLAYFCGGTGGGSGTICNCPPCA
jgi:hypothetical protein